MNEWIYQVFVIWRIFLNWKFFFLILITLNVNYLKILLAIWFLHLLLFNVCVVVVCCRCSHFSLLRFLITIMMRRCDMFIIMMIIRLINLFFSAKSRNFFFLTKTELVHHENPVQFLVWLCFHQKCLIIIICFLSRFLKLWLNWTQYTWCMYVCHEEYICCPLFPQWISH